MNRGKTTLGGIGLIITLLLFPPSWTNAGEQRQAVVAPPAVNDIEFDPCREAVGLLKKQKTELSGELRQIKREIAALRQSREKPGIREIMAGIGYILGLFGIGFYMSARKKQTARGE